MKIFHGSYKKIESFKTAPIWGSDLFDTANNYILCQSEGETGEFGFIYTTEIDDSSIVFVDDFASVDCGSILTAKGDVFSAVNEGGDRIFCIRDASKYNWNEA